ncbi:flagellar hook-length control protein FliK [Oceanimonas baumannii]|uniref:flagellar hook-length control protein FliK n=1 Tax=Oceanimonas baumannii TaxID=129578 RepID=UPI001D18E696|nr:flagellar hook-length control protein FliK [Oceanimonas baumannii]MCC4263177.1 flagellar hook-length control protein FliK [Oceanimonas baumannii]
MTTVISILSGGMGSANAAMQPQPEGDRPDFSELLKTAEADASQPVTSTSAESKGEVNDSETAASGQADEPAKDAAGSEQGQDPEDSQRPEMAGQHTTETTAPDQPVSDEDAGAARLNTAAVPPRTGNLLPEAATSGTGAPAADDRLPPGRPEQAVAARQPAEPSVLQQVASEPAGRAEAGLQINAGAQGKADADSTKGNEPGRHQSDTLAKGADVVPDDVVPDDVAPDKVKASDHGDKGNRPQGAGSAVQPLPAGAAQGNVADADSASVASNQNKTAGVATESGQGAVNTGTAARRDEQIPAGEQTAAQRSDKAVTTEQSLARAAGPGDIQVSSADSRPVAEQAQSVQSGLKPPSETAPAQHNTVNAVTGQSKGGQVPATPGMEGQSGTQRITQPAQTAGTADLTQPEVTADNGHDEPAAPLRQETAAAQKEAQRQTAAPDWLAQIEHGRRWAQQGSAELKTDAPAVTSDEMGLSAADSSAGEAKDQDGSAGENAGRGERLAEAMANMASAAGAENTARASSEQQSQPAAAISATRDVAGAMPERAAQPQADRLLNLHQASPEHNARQLSQQVQVMINQDLQEADIRLNPSELGGMRIQLKFEQGEVSMHIQAQHAQARDMLEQAMPRLRDMLSQQGIQLGQGQVGSFAGQQQGSAQNGGSGQGATGRENGHNSSSFEQGRNDDETAYGGYAPDAQVRDGRIDFFA